MTENFEKIKKSIIDLSKLKIEELVEKEMKIAEKKYLESKKLISSETRKSKRKLDSERRWAHRPNHPRYRGGMDIRGFFVYLR